MDGPIASAVVLPEEPTPPTVKRRQSSIDEENNKRPRLDNDIPNNSRDAIDENKPAVPKRRERGRERRLFGAVLGALSQPGTATAAQKRRLEIEKRQLAQRKQETEQNEQRKTERVARRKNQRWKEHRRFEREMMRSKHETLLNAAHFLQTKSSPQLYYKPWETTAEEDERIQEQIAEAHKIIKRDLDEYETRQELQANRERRGSRDADTNHNADGASNGKEQDANATHQVFATNGGANESHNSPKDQVMIDEHAPDHEHEAVRTEGATDVAVNDSVPSHEVTADEASKDNDENGEDVVEEAAEDTVIY